MIRTKLLKELQQKVLKKFFLASLNLISQSSQVKSLIKIGDQEFELVSYSWQLTVSYGYNSRLVPIDLCMSSSILEVQRYTCLLPLPKAIVDFSDSLSPNIGLSILNFGDFRDSGLNLDSKLWLVNNSINCFYLILCPYPSRRLKRLKNSQPLRGVRRFCCKTFE